MPTSPLAKATKRVLSPPKPIRMSEKSSHLVHKKFVAEFFKAFGIEEILEVEDETISKE